MMGANQDFKDGQSNVVQNLRVNMSPHTKEMQIKKTHTQQSPPIDTDQS